jgi:hypothetical protein
VWSVGAAQRGEQLAANGGLLGKVTGIRTAGSLCKVGLVTSRWDCCVALQKWGEEINGYLLCTNRAQPSGHYMYRPVVTICTVQWSLYVPYSGHYLYHTMVTIRTVQWSLFVPHNGHYMYRTVVTICTASLTFSNSTFCPHSCIYVFCVDLGGRRDIKTIQH